jgi:hypothetical protein
VWHVKCCGRSADAQTGSEQGLSQSASDKQWSASRDCLLGAQRFMATPLKQLTTK